MNKCIIKDCIYKHRYVIIKSFDLFSTTPVSICERCNQFIIKKNYNLRKDKL